MTVDEFAQARPAPALQPFVAFYSGYRQGGIAPGRHRGLPSPNLTLIFTMEEPLDVAVHPDPRQRAGSYRSLIGGLHLTPALITHPGRQSGVHVALLPLGCRRLFGLPAAELVGLDVDAAAVLGDGLVGEIRNRICAGPDWPRRFAAVDAIFQRLLRLSRKNMTPEIAYAWRRLTTATAPVASVAAEIGWSGRHLTDRFRAEVGLRPKEAARVARFDRARHALRPDCRLADVAADHGYADQSHLVRDFQAFAGCPPSRWLADEFGVPPGPVTEFGFVQAGSARPGEDLWHD